MKKITLLLVAFLAMSGGAFGQKEGKVLWETSLDSVYSSSVKWLNFGTMVSPAGNILTNFRYYFDDVNLGVSDIKVFDKNGKPLWKANDFYKTPAPYYYVNTKTDYTLINNYYLPNSQTSDRTLDSTLYLTKDFKLIKKFENNPGITSYTMHAENGIFRYSNPAKALIKYNLSGQEEWRYQSKYPIYNAVNDGIPFIGLFFVEDRTANYILFSKNGKKRGVVSGTNHNLVYPTNDEGFWQNTNAELIKYDSLANQTAKILLKDIVPQSANLKVITKVAPDNSVFVAYIDTNYDINIIKVDSKGNISKTTKNVGIKASLDQSAKDGILNGISVGDIKITPKEEVLYSINYSYFSKAIGNPQLSDGIIGGMMFNNSNFDWSKLVYSTNLARNIDFYTGDENIIEVKNSYSASRAVTGNNVAYFGLDGTLKWTYSEYFIKEIARIDNRVFLSYEFTSSRLFILDYQTGKLLKQIDNCSVNSIKDDIRMDKAGRIFILNSFKDGSNNSKRITILQNDGSDFRQYVNPNIDQFKIDDIGNIITTSFEKESNSTKIKFILRKIKFCNELLSTATASATEACPTEKIKLSIPKQDGVTYQWQKDGKDLPNVTDAVYDFGEAGTYTVVVKDELCQNQAISNALKINIRSLATAQITAPKSTFCEGDKTTIAATTNGTFFQWQKDEKDIPNATSGIYEVSQAGNYRVGVRDDKCPQVGFSNVFTINVKPTPEAKISTDIKGVIFEPFTVKMTANSGTGLSYQWLKDDVIIPNETTANYEAKQSGKYNVSVTKDGCIKTSEALNISILIPLANEGEIGEDVVKIYPNPNRGDFNLILPKSLQNADIQLFDMLGRERSLVYIGEQAQAGKLPTGTYFLKVSKGEKSIINKIVIE